MWADGSIVVFARAPGAGKTRLAAELGAAQAAALSRAFLLDTLRSADSIAPSSVWAASEADAAVLGPELGREVRVQCGGDLGDRMRDACAAHPRTIVIGSDAPSLPPRLIRAAIAALERADFVLGPSADGGYYLFGARAPVPRLAPVRWSTRHALADTRAALGPAVAVLAPWFDVDTAEDLRVLAAELAVRPSRAPHTARLLTRSGWRG